MLVINNKYPFLLLLIILALAKEFTRANKVLKVLILKIVKLKKPANKIN
jgi:hypothetical protein